MIVATTRDSHTWHQRDLGALLAYLLAGTYATGKHPAAERRLVATVAALARVLRLRHIGQEDRCTVSRVRPRTWWRSWRRRSRCAMRTALTVGGLPPGKVVSTAGGAAGGSERPL
ncbi:hypothetical protein [Amycolatopsis sp. YIM 10]|uniref:hypothetical protein n=1 Tax=Amycolatopsis sp. YIM 10 TaxID=2653857 RepID=UPI0012905A1C|nr:hypothetical protein [Amycolatopsis sp. YIM 10]QFU86677.1 hypothetical protein YIM_07330 [Amycolatopsis sp. YIM 10]